jgi:hypothetical protein
LDYQGLDISKAWYLNSSGSPIEAAYDVHHDANLGSAIRIYLTDRVYSGNFVNVLIEYTSNA